MANEGYVNIMKKIWIDEEYKKKFKANPRGMMKQEGLENIASEIEVVEQSAEKIYFVISSPPADVTAWGKEQMAMAERAKCAANSCSNTQQLC